MRQSHSNRFRLGEGREEVMISRVVGEARKPSADSMTYLRRCPCWRPRTQPTRHARRVDGQQEQDQDGAVVAGGGSAGGVHHGIACLPFSLCCVCGVKR